MIIEFSTAKPAQNYSGLSLALLVMSAAFFFIPTTLIVLGYYSSLPTGTLVSPLPQGVVSSSPSTVEDRPSAQPVIAAPETPDSLPAESATSSSNLSSKVATIPADQTEATVTDPDVLPTSQIYLSTRADDDSIYSVKSKQNGQMIIMSTSSSPTERVVDYHIVNL